MQFPHKNAVHLVGSKNSGKSKLMQFLIREFTEKAYRVGALKHSSHSHPLDKPGSDSDKFRQAGAIPTVFSTPDGFTATFSGIDENQQIDSWKRIFSTCDLVLIESFRQAEGPKIWLCSDESWEQIPDQTVVVVHPDRRHPMLPSFVPSDPELINWLIKYFHLTKTVD